MDKRFAIVIGVAAAGVMALGLQTAAAADATYVALGESYAAGVGASSPEKSYVGRLFSHYQSALGVNQLSNRAVGGSNVTSTSLRNGGQLSNALADINAPSDTRVVTISIGGNDGQFGCSHRWDDPTTCPFRANFSSTLAELSSALDADPGEETFEAMAYPNPASGTGGGAEASYDTGLLGANLAIGCSDTGPDAGLNDVIFQEAGRLGVPVADTYPAFKQGGQSFLADIVHPNDAGYAAIANAFLNPKRTCKAEIPTNEFSFGKVKKNKRKGTAKLTIEIVEGPGELNLAGTKKVKPDDEAVEGEGAIEEKLAIKPKGKAKKKLNNKGKAKVTAEVTYTPDGGEPNTESERIKLVKR